MHFVIPELLYALWGVVPLILFFIWAGRRRNRLLERFASPTVIKELTLSVNVDRARWKAGLIVGVYVCAVLALARPQWGFEWQEIKRQGLDIIFVIDTSKSMLTQDIKPSRLERTRLGVKDFVKRLKGDRVGIVAFAGQAFLVCPLTIDYNGFILSLDDLNTGTIPLGGTDLAAALQEAFREYDTTPAKYKVVIIFTDGENLVGDPLAMARRAKEQGIKIYCVGVGTAEGELIQLPDEKGGSQFLKDEQGNFVKSRLNETLLQKIAEASGGGYIRAGGADMGLDALYDRELSHFERRDFEQKREKQFIDRFQFPLGLAVILLLVDTCLTRRRRLSHDR